MAFAAYWMSLKGDTPKIAPQTSRFQSQQATSTSSSKVSTGKPAQHEKGSAQSSAAAATVKPASTAGAAGSASTPHVKQQADPFDALGDTLPSQPLAPKVPKFTGPEITESNIRSEKLVKCGENENTLPPGYRWKDMEKNKPAGAPEKRQDVPKPVSTDEALDSLSAGFVSAAPSVSKQTEPKTGLVAAVDATSKGCSNFAPPPQQKQSTASSACNKSPVPPADKKAKLEKPGEKSSSSTGPSSSPAQPSKPKMDEADSSMPADALSALGDILGAPEPPKKQPELKPGDIFDEKKVKPEKGVFVGEREDSLPPKYRFSEEELKKLPPLPKEPSLDTNEALDVLSGDFKSSYTPQISNCPPIKPPAKPSDDFALDALADEFVASSSASKVQSAVTGPSHAERQLSDGSSSALDALSDTLAEIKPVPEPTPVPPKAVIKEKDIVEERVSKPGERDDTLPPDYRFSETDRKAFAAAKDVKPKQPSLDDTAALDLLSSDFSAAPAVKSSTPKAKKPCGDSSAVDQVSGQMSSSNVVSSSSTNSGKR